MKRKNIFRLLPAVALVAIGTAVSVFAAQKGENRELAEKRMPICRMVTAACPEGGTSYHCTFNLPSMYQECDPALNCSSRECIQGPPR